MTLLAMGYDLGHYLDPSSGQTAVGPHDGCEYSVPLLILTSQQISTGPRWSKEETIALLFLQTEYPYFRCLSTFATSTSLTDAGLDDWTPPDMYERGDIVLTNLHAMAIVHHISGGYLRRRYLPGPRQSRPPVPVATPHLIPAHTSLRWILVRPERRQPPTKYHRWFQLWFFSLCICTFPSAFTLQLHFPIGIGLLPFVGLLSRVLHPITNIAICQNDQFDSSRHFNPFFFPSAASRFPIPSYTRPIVSGACIITIPDAFRDAAGRQVSLLNEEPQGSHGPGLQRLSYHVASQVISQPYHPFSARSSSSSIPNTPELLRSDSYDSNMSAGPKSPLTPTTYEYAHGHNLVPLVGGSPDEFELPAKRPLGLSASRSNSYDDEPSPANSVPDGRAGKRYPCRYRETHGCEKTFTTSGHASRHSKIHTAEKAVQCTFPGCQKKFTRADNMKQHLETHYKDKSRPMGSVKTSARSSVGGVSASARRSSSTSSSSSARTSTHARSVLDRSPWDMEPYSFAPTSATSVTSTSPWDLRGLNGPLMSRHSAARTPSSGLDALAMAVACQENLISAHFYIVRPPWCGAPIPVVTCKRFCVSRLWSLFSYRSHITCAILCMPRVDLGDLQAMMLDSGWIWPNLHPHFHDAIGQRGHIKMSALGFFTWHLSSLRCYVGLS
ncbi:hypothetical protein SODALDRAFT_380498 [Sodiomyces alkalinus F11]|uniref:C2H2 type master regulator of conidiophore development brlA n=1 Tax=Sodiomyces alkalinus (strain CBS 110278 / VKM F-3762 / F11) TaxID=1314773 RepID=A0A3N2PRA0_SODAK|nr:hypothetical protein SODALDRAFT_380498 [Sodiomyces alkalinus F11]ROT37015.1 hypothetical protein SODALDRAFT_380498 [Sodiomyces alkalinus F11]